MNAGIILSNAEKEKLQCTKNMTKIHDL